MTTDKELTSLSPQEEFDGTAESGGIQLRHFLAILVRRKRFLLQMMIGGGALAGVIAIVLPSTYTAVALILPPAKPQSLSTALMGQLGGFAGAVAPSLGLKDPSDLYLGILRSRTLTGALVSQFGLQQIYSSPTKEGACRELLDHLSLSSRDSMIRISVEDRDPKRAAILANAFVVELNRQNNRLAITESAQRRIFFEHEVEVEKNALATAESALANTQQRTGVLEVDSQAQVVIGSIARLRAQIAMQEVSLQGIRMAATSENPDVLRQQTELSALQSQLSKLEAGTSRQRSGDPLVPVANVPQAGLEYLRALREVKYHNSLFEVLSRQYEAARIDEAKEAPVIQVVDIAVPPERKSGPPRTFITLLGAVFSLIAGVVFVNVVDSKAPAELLPNGPATEPVEV